MDQRPAARAIAHVVQAERAAVALLEGVRVMPQRVRAAELDIHELVGRIPLGDFRAPADGNPMHADSIINERAGPHRIGPGVSTSNFSQGGVRVSRLRASAKKGKTSLAGGEARARFGG